VATVEGDRLRLHDAAAGRVVADVRLSEDPRPVVTVPVSFPHARYAVARPHYRDGVDLVVIDLDRGRVGLNLPNFDAHGWAFSPDGRHLVTLHSGSGTLVWDLARPAAEPVARLPRGGTARFSPDGRVLAVDGHGCLALYDTATWRLLPQSASPVAAVRSVRFTPGGRGLVALTGDGWWEWADWSKPDARRLFGPADGHQSSASDLSADGQVVAEMVSALSLGPKAPPAAELRVTDRRTGKARTFPGARWASRDPVLSGDGRRVFTWLPEDSEVRGWDTATGDPLRTWPVAKTPQLEATLATSHDGKWVALFPETQGGSAGVAGARVWDVDGGREVSRIPGVAGAGPGDERTAEFSRDGRRLAAVVHTPAERPQTTVRVWDWRAGRQLMSAPVFFFLTAVTLSADGRACAVGEFDGRVRVFEVASGGERAAFRHGARVGAVALHPDGTRVAASSPEAPVYVWDLLPGPARWDPARADAVWADLAADAKVAFAAMQALRANPAAAVEFLRGRSPLPPAPTDERVADLLKGLDAPAFAERERSQKELAAVIEWVRPKLEAARKAASEEAGRRLDQVLKPGDPPTADQLRQVRACEVLEALGTAEAAKLLRTWAGGPAGARLTAEAQESLDRLRN
jgi:WD40 repeat protein